MSFFQCSGSEFWDLTFQNCRNVSFEEQNLQANQIKGIKDKKIKEHALIDLKQSKASRLSLKRNNSAKSLKSDSMSSSNSKFDLRNSKNQIVKRNQYGICAFPEQNTPIQRTNSKLAKRVSITYQTPENRNNAHSHSPAFHKFSPILNKQSMHTQPSTVQAKSQITHFPEIQSHHIQEPFQNYFACNPFSQKLHHEKVQNSSPSSNLLIGEKMTVKKRSTLNSFSPKEIASQVDGNEEKSEDFSIVVERYNMPDTPSQKAPIKEQNYRLVSRKRI